MSVKLESLFNKWEKLYPGFHNWFVKKRKELFEDSVIQSARQDFEVTGLYYQNNIGSLHFVEKLQQSFTKKSPDEVAEILQLPHNRQQVEETRRIYGTGKYVLAPEYKQFMTESSTWHTWSEKTRRDDIAAFKAY